MKGLELYSHSLLDDQLWYVGHPVHPTDEDVAAYHARLAELQRSDPAGYAPPPDLDRTRRWIIENNIASAKTWLAWLIRAFPKITFIAPWIATLDGGGDDDLDPEMRARGLRDCCRTIRRCDGMVLVGGRVSGGMTEERGHARAVVDLTFLGRVPPVSLELTA